MNSFKLNGLENEGLNFLCTIQLEFFATAIGTKRFSQSHRRSFVGSNLLRRKWSIERMQISVRISYAHLRPLKATKRQACKKYLLVVELKADSRQSSLSSSARSINSTCALVTNHSNIVFLTRKHKPTPSLFYSLQSQRSRSTSELQLRRGSN